MSRQKYLQISTEENVDNHQQEPPLDVDENQQLDEEENVEFIPKRSKRQRKAKRQYLLVYIWSKELEMKYLLVFHIY